MTYIRCHVFCTRIRRSLLSVRHNVTVPTDHIDLFRGRADKEWMLLKTDIIWTLTRILDKTGEKARERGTERVRKKVEEVIEE